MYSVDLDCRSFSTFLCSLSSHLTTEHIGRELVRESELSTFFRRQEKLWQNFSSPLISFSATFYPTHNFSSSCRSSSYSFSFSPPSLPSFQFLHPLPPGGRPESTTFTTTTSSSHRILIILSSLVPSSWTNAWQYFSGQSHFPSLSPFFPFFLISSYIFFPSPLIPTSLCFSFLSLSSFLLPLLVMGVLNVQKHLQLLTFLVERREKHIS